MHVGIFHTAFVGDVALLGLLIESLVDEGHDVTLFTNRAGMQLFQEDPRVRKCVLIEKGQGLKKASLIFASKIKMAAENLEVLLVPHRSATSSLIAKLSGVRKTIGFSDSDLAWLYKEKMPRDKTQHEVIRVLNLAPDWLVRPEVKTRFRLLGRTILKASPIPKDLVRTHPELFGSEPQKPYLVVAPGSVWGTKIYPPEKYALAVSHVLNAQPDLQCVITGGPTDRQTIADFLAAMDANCVGRLINTAGRIHLGELISVIRGAKIVVTNDSAPVHIASGTNTPTVAIFGPTIRENGFWPTAEHSVLINYATEYGSPLPCQPCSIHGPKVCPLGHHRCMRDLSSSVVETAVQKILRLQKASSIS